jgi:hypothetical protein
MDLVKTEYSLDKGTGKLDKILLNCKETNFYNLIEFLYTSQNRQAIVMKTLFDNKIDIVLKFSILQYIDQEYKINLDLYNLPNFIRYFCKIICNDNIKNIINHKETIMNYKMCHYGDKPVGILVMKYYKLGYINDYLWNYENFNVLKNVILQVILALIYAFESKGFLHGDLHSGNVLLKNKKKMK